MPLDASPPLERRLSNGAPLDMPAVLAAVLYGPLNLQALPGSGATQALLMARLLCAAGMRAVDQSGPPGVAIFTDSRTAEPLAAMAPDVALVWLMSGLAAEQAECEAHYAAELRRPLLVARLLDRLAQVRLVLPHAPPDSPCCSPPFHAVPHTVQPSVLCTACTLQIRDACPHAVDAVALAVALAPLTVVDTVAVAAPPPPRARADDEPHPKAARTQEAATPAPAAAPTPAAWAASDEELEARVAALVKCAAPLLGASELQLEREWQALLSSHATLANACLARFLGATHVHLQEATLLPSKVVHRVRVVLTLFDCVEHADQQQPRRFAWIPSLLAVLRVQGTDDLTREMLARVWRELLTQGFWPSASLQEAIEPSLKEWLASCLRHGSAAGVPLRAAVRPQMPLCLYLHGEAGSGKSSFVRALLPALAATLRAYLDPELAAHSVKQTLNKPLEALQLEFERRPNNNDLSVVSVVSMAREPLSGAADRPKLLLLGLEEMPPAAPAAAVARPANTDANANANVKANANANAPAATNPATAADANLDAAATASTAASVAAALDRADCTQLEVSSLLAKRFGNALGHPDLLAVFTSNYALHPVACAALETSATFRGLRTVRIV